ncbi:hypothetical protein [Haloarcula pellucida]|uniref:Uncharacterized protein n=1 Tax=Haloarcula pellucida TaxID=1427151 RepID=A0A830GQ13_9EURY|nr:hypothetical protein [Halomicroarcula pellucida]MBX0349418.1 hypothetical protein [Halomicroarcula pellucida]GGO03029.1 hypothetical protein GCM10009030_38270 [Halomicroarcula pellucida]
MTDPFKQLEDASTKEIINVFINHVTKTDEEIAEEGREKKKKTTELKIYIAENRGFDPEKLNSRILTLLESEDTNHYPTKYFNEHNFEIDQLNEDTYHLGISTPKYERSDDFVLVNSDGYLKALTVIRKKWAENTIEKLIKYIPELDRLFLSSNDLESMVRPIDKRDLTGFTAKFQPFYSDEQVSVQVHGGSKNHLEKVESQFKARPKRIVFSQRNSPAEAVKGAVSQDGYASIPRVRRGSEDVGFEAIDDLIDRYQRRDQENFSVPYRPERITPGDRYILKQQTLEDSQDNQVTDGGLSEALKRLDQGSVLEGLTICELEEKMPDDGYPDDQAVAEKLKENILEYKQRYAYSVCGDGNFMVYDRELGESFEIIISDKNIRVYTKSNTSSRSLRDFYEVIDAQFNSTYDVNHISKKVRA